ncbi:MAG: hypothetical protein ACYC8V_03250 [Caulobacteraceae bacterium]
MERAEQRLLDEGPSRRMLTVSTDTVLNTMRKLMREVAFKDGLAA